MELEKALQKYKNVLMKSTNFHVYLTNACYDNCAHCYMGAVPPKSRKAKYIDYGDLIHFVSLMEQGTNGTFTTALSGGEPLLHPEIVPIMDNLANYGNLEVLTSGFALSPKNPNRAELLDALIRNKPCMEVAHPTEPYHSITWQDIDEIKEYVKQKGYKLTKLGYPSKSKEIFQKVMLALHPIGFTAMLVSQILEKCSDKMSKPPALAIGRAKNLPEGQQRKVIKKCKMFGENNDPVTIGYMGNIQYGFYACHDGFMNIKELRGINNKKDAVDFIIEKLSQDITFQDMAKFNEWYFSDNIRKRNVYTK